MEGAGLGLGGFLTVVPDMGILSAITLRMLQKLSLLYGFAYATEEENGRRCGLRRPALRGSIWGVIFWRSRPSSGWSRGLSTGWR